MEEYYKAHVEKCLADAENKISKINDEILALEGASGEKTRHLYNNLLNMDDARYLEIGTWRGSTVCSAMYNNSASVICVDNWSLYGGLENKEFFMDNFKKYRGKNFATFIEQDCFTIDVTALPKFNIYMYDGEHTHESQYRALTHFYDCMDDLFIYVVDDLNYEVVQTGTRAAIRDLDLKIIYEKEIFTPNGIVDGKNWWNGVYIAVFQKTK